MLHCVNGGAELLARAIGARVRSERKHRRRTLDQLAAAGMGRRAVANAEQGSVNPSLGTRLRLSGALSLGLPSAVAPPPPCPARVNRHGAGAVLWSGGQGVLVAGTEPPDVVEMWDWSLSPGERHVSGAQPAGTRELLHIKEGRITAVVYGAAHELSPGDALEVFEPGVGSAHRSEGTDA